MLDLSSPIPLYYQLEALIEEQIDTGKWKAGDRVPSEAELGEQFQISRTTVRQALGDLVNRGRLTRIQGKGTFVAQPRIQQGLTHLTGFSQDMQQRGQKPSARLLQFEVVSALPQVAKSLQIHPGELVILLKRLRLADDEPMALETSYISYPLCSSILKEDLSDTSLYQLLREKVKIFPHRARQQMEAVGCPSTEAKLLGVVKGSPALHIWRTTFDQYDRPFEWVESFYRGDRYVFSVEMIGE